MALFTVNIDSVAGGNSTFTGIPGRKMFNTTRVSQLSEFGTDDSAFEYCIEWDGDVQTSVCLAEDTVAEILVYFAAEWVSGAIPLTSYPYGDLDTKERVYLDPKIILFGGEFTGYTKLILSHSRELWVVESITDILNLAVQPYEIEGWSDGTSYFRLDVRDGELNLDQTIAPSTNFRGTEGVNWDYIWSKSVSEVTPTYPTILDTYINNDDPDKVYIVFSEEIDTDKPNPSYLPIYVDSININPGNNHSTSDSITIFIIFMLVLSGC